MQNLPDFKMEVAFDEERVRREGKYDIDKMWAVVDKYFAEHNLPKIAKGLYVSTGHKDDYSYLGGFYLTFRNVGWFRETIRVFNWYEREDYGTEYDTEDWLDAPEFQRKIS